MKKIINKVNNSMYDVAVAPSVAYVIGVPIFIIIGVMLIFFVVLNLIVKELKKNKELIVAQKEAERRMEKESERKIEIQAEKEIGEEQNGQKDTITK